MTRNEKTITLKKNVDLVERKKYELYERTISNIHFEGQILLKLADVEIYIYFTRSG